MDRETPATKSLKRTIFIYLYRLNGVPVYVGQALDVAKRDRDHCKGSLPFEKFLQRTGREKFTLEIVDSVRDVPHGRKACKLENQIMDKFGTFCSLKGWNFGRAVQNHTEKRWAAHHAAIRTAHARPEVRASLKAANKAAWSKPEIRAKMSAAMKAAHARPEVRAKMEAAAQRKAKDPKWRAKHKAATRRRSGRPEWLAKIKAANQRKAQDPKYCAKLSASLKAYWVCLKGKFPGRETRMYLAKKRGISELAIYIEACQKFGRKPAPSALKKIFPRVLPANSREVL